MTAGAASQSVKDALRQATEEAVDKGVIGVPTLVVDDEVFWGDDRLEEAAAAMRARSIAASRPGAR